MATAWEILMANSSGGVTAWDHVNNQQGNTYIEHLEVELMSDTLEVEIPEETLEVEVADDSIEIEVKSDTIEVEVN